MKCSLATFLLMLFLAINPLSRKMKKRDFAQLVPYTDKTATGSYGIVSFYTLLESKIAVKFLKEKEKTNYDDLFLNELQNFRIFCRTDIFPKINFLKTRSISDTVKECTN